MERRMHENIHFNTLSSQYPPCKHKPLQNGQIYTNNAQNVYYTDNAAYNAFNRQPHTAIEEENSHHKFSIGSHKKNNSQVSSHGGDMKMQRPNGVRAVQKLGNVRQSQIGSADQNQNQNRGRRKSSEHRVNLERRNQQLENANRRLEQENNSLKREIKRQEENRNREVIALNGRFQKITSLVEVLAKKMGSAEEQFREYMKGLQNMKQEEHLKNGKQK